MPWQTPKTDWKASDYFNIGDYNRIIGNIACLREMAVKVYPAFSLEDMGDEKQYADYLYADEVNTIERNLTALCENTYPFFIGEEKTYYPNLPTPDWQEFNRIESACLTMYLNLSGQMTGRRRLAFVLGGMRI